MVSNMWVMSLVCRGDFISLRILKLRILNNVTEIR